MMKTGKYLFPGYWVASCFALSGMTVSVVFSAHIPHMKSIVEDGLMGRVYRKEKERGAKVPFLSSVAPVSIILASTMQLAAIYIIAETPPLDFQDYWCGAFGLQAPLIYMLILVWVLMLIYLVVDGVRVIHETGRLKGSFLAIFVVLFALTSGEVYSYFSVLDNNYINSCEPYVESSEPSYRIRWSDPIYAHFYLEYRTRSNLNARPLCPSGKPSGRWCRNSRLPEKEFLKIGRDVFGPDWHPGVEMKWRDVQKALDEHAWFADTH